MIGKLVYYFKLNHRFLTFQFIIPTVQVTLFCLAIGRDPTDLTMAVVNEENFDQWYGSCAYLVDQQGFSTGLLTGI